MKKISLIIFVLFVSTLAEEIETRKTVKKSAALHLEPRAEGDEATEAASAAPVVTTSVAPTTTQKVITTSAAAEAPVTTTAQAPSTTEAASTTSAASTTTATFDSSESSEISNAVDISDVNTSSELPDIEDTADNSLIFPAAQPPKRKIIYVNQQQNGKLNVHLELSDVSVLVIPNQKNNQQSLLNLLFKSVQKSNEKKKNGNKLADDHHDAYSMYKQSIRNSNENDHFSAANIPFIESRAPYKVDISSTLGQQSHPAVDITPNAHQQPNPMVHQLQSQFARSPIMQLLKPIPYTIQTAPNQAPHNRIYKRSIDSRLLGIEAEIPNDSENSVNYGEDELTESILNSLDNDEEVNSISNIDGSDFVLLGATENCGPGRRRNSYQICVAIEDETN